ncbi:MAG: lipopolysaccharide heptosyltransferase II [Acidobacteria bacterium]|nr:lipopolysaccharide heptosyltransferase II [Acidobacteriota bacterium]
MRILVRVPNWIGDAALSVAALRELRRLGPNDHLCLLCRSWVAGMFEDLGVADEILTIPDAYFVPRGKPRLKLSALKKLADDLHEGGFQRAILFQNAFEAALLARAAAIPERIGYARDARGWLLTVRARRKTKRASGLRSLVMRSATRLGIENSIAPYWKSAGLRYHEVYDYLDLLYQAGISPVNYLAEPGYAPNLQLHVGDAARKRAEEYLRAVGVGAGYPLVLINPGAAYGAAKHWFAERFAEVADRLAEDRKATILVFGWDDSLETAGRVTSFMRRRGIVLSGPADLARTMGLIASCHLLITSDSGPAHLAAGLGAPAVVLFGSTDCRTTAPWSGRAVNIQERVECSPCHLRNCPLDMRCWSLISVERVFREAVALLDKTSHGPFGTGT